MKKKMITLLTVAALAVASPAAAQDQDAITRLDFCRTMDGMLTQAGVLAPLNYQTAPFTDTADAAVHNLYRHGLISGTGAQTFSPEASLTREETAVILDRIFAKAKVQGADGIKTTKYADEAAISDWAEDSVYRMQKYGILVGTGEDKFSPKATLTNEQAEAIALRVQNKLNPQAVTEVSLGATLDSLTATPRWAGTAEEVAARTYLADTLTKYGYTVETQTFEFMPAKALAGKQTSNVAANIIATKPAAQPNADILIISSHFDTVSGTVGANDNASGTVVLLEAAKAVAALDTDTEIRFIAFGAEEQGRLGSAHYVAQLSDAEKARIIGDIQLDMLGHYRSNAMQIKTTAGEDTLVGNMISDSAVRITGQRPGKVIESASDHTSFVSGGVPAILLMQDNIGVENHKVVDNASILSTEKLKESTDIVVDTIKKVADAKTTDLAKQARQITNVENPAYTFRDETIFFFNEKKALNDGRAGGPGKLVGTRHDDGLDWDFEDYLYNARWFGMPQPVPTIFEYRVLNDERYLLNITIDYSKSGYSMQQVKDTLTKRYGEPTVYEKEAIWQNTRYVKQYIVNEEAKTVSVASAFYGSGETIHNYDVSNGIEQYQDAPAKEQKLLQFLQNIIGDDGFVDTLEVWSDGLSYQLGATYPTVDKQNDKFTLRIDIEDVFDDVGNYRNLDKTLATFVHEYGHVLTLNNTQTDMSKKDMNKFYYDEACFLEGSYIQNFYNTFWKEYNTESAHTLYFSHPEWFVNEYASQDSNEDIAESFAMFVLTDKPSGNTIAEQKINFFYQYPELVDVRNRIRTAFAL